jgi:glycyl-tRNA synthetase (class II)
MNHVAVQIFCFTDAAAPLFLIILHHDRSLHTIRDHNVIIQLTLGVDSNSIPKKYSRKNEIGLPGCCL